MEANCLNANNLFIAMNALSSKASSSLYELTQNHVEQDLVKEKSDLKKFLEVLDTNLEGIKPLNKAQKWVYIHYQSTGLLARIAKVIAWIWPRASLSERLDTINRALEKSILENPEIHSSLNNRLQGLVEAAKTISDRKHNQKIVTSTPIYLPVIPNIKSVPV